jgi:hypothetical protein
MRTQNTGIVPPILLPPRSGNTGIVPAKYRTPVAATPDTFDRAPNGNPGIVGPGNLTPAHANGNTGIVPPSLFAELAELVVEWF